MPASCSSIGATNPEVSAKTCSPSIGQISVVVLGEVAQPAAMASKDGERSSPLVGPTLPLQFFFNTSARQFGNAAPHCRRPLLLLLVGGRLEFDLRSNYDNIMVSKYQHVNKIGLSFH